jgi:hypothetical protein
VRIDCTEARRQIDLRADGRLPDVGALEEHLTACPPCREQAHGLDWIGAALQRGRASAGPGFADHILRRVADVHPAPRPRPIPRRAPAVAALLMAAGLAAVVLLQRAPLPPTEPPRVRVELELSKIEARTVAVAGDFNEWQVEASKMTRGDDGVWRIRLELPPGRYQYVFVIDDERWIADPRATTVVDSGFSGANSILDVSL